MDERKFIIKENIIPLKALMPFEERTELFKELNWPLEIQGTGRTMENNNFEIRYPKGDKFFSMAVIIHELGHLRQDEFIDFDQNENKNIQKEKDAYNRGWARLNKYYPEFLNNLELNFKEYKQKQKIKDFDSFKDLYDFLKGSIIINQALENLGDEATAKEEIIALKKAGVDNFFDKINQNKVGKIIDETEADDIIFKIVKLIAQE